MGHGGVGGHQKKLFGQQCWPVREFGPFSSYLGGVSMIGLHPPPNPTLHPHVWIMEPRTLRFINREESTSRKELDGCWLGSIGGQLGSFRVGWGLVEGWLGVRV